MSRRSSRLSAEPQSAPSEPASTTTTKRKRGSTADLEEKENVSKPASTRSTRRGPSAAPSASSRARGAKSTRSVSGKGKPDLQDVPESGDEHGEQEEEEEEIVKKPAKKKARPSTSEDEHEEESVGDDYEEEEEAPKPKRRTTKSTASKTKSKTKTAKAPPPPPTIREENADDDDDMSFLEQEPRKPKSISQAPRTPTKSKRPRAESDDAPESSLLEPSGSVPQYGTPLRSPAKSFYGSPSKLDAIPAEPERPKSRLVIHKMALVNFKSYAGRQEIGPFHKSFSAIVGPNGSGKSNTIDSLLFVFGYRANKMRQGKLSELIHNSAKYPDLDSCSVEVHFREIRDLEDPEAFEVVPNSQLVVARHAYRNNSSRYTINDKSATFTEVQTLLKGRGIDLDHKRFLILQGEVESISQMPPKSQTGHDEGLLEYLEDIIGSNKYKEGIDEASGEMEKLDEDRREKINRLKYVEKERDALAKKKQEAEDFLRSQNDLVRARSYLWQYYIYVGFKNEEKFQREEEHFKAKLEEERNKHKDLIEHITSLEDFFSKKSAAYAEVKEKAAIAKADLDSAQGDQMALQERKKHGDKKLNKVKKTMDDDEKNRKAAMRVIEESEEKVEKETQSIQDREEELKLAEVELGRIQDSLSGKTKKFQAKIEEKQAELGPWMEKINKKEADVKVSTSERDTLLKKEQEMKAANEQAQEELRELKSDVKVKIQEREKLQDEHSGLGQAIEDADAHLRDAKARQKELNAAANAARGKYNEAKSSQEATRSQGKVLDSLMRMKREGRLDGFHGRLGSLGTIDDKYDVAVTTACGQLNNIVVDTVKTAEAAMDYMRRNNVGRATFMVLEKLREAPTQFDSPPEHNTGVNRLYNLVKPKDPMYAKAFFKALNHTIVANDLDQAKRIAYGQRRWRVVTLSGQIIETSGAMSGGGGAPMRGGMSSKLQKDPVGPEQLRKLEQEADRLFKQHSEVLKEVREAEMEVERLNNEGPKREMELKKLEMDIEGGKRRIEDEEKRVKNLQSQSKLDPKQVARIKELEKIIAKHTDELEQLRAQTTDIEEAIAELEQQILDAGGVKLLAQKSKVDSINQFISISNDEITKAEVASAKAAKDIKKFEKSVKNNQQLYEDQNTELTQIKEELDELEKYIDQVEEQVSAASDAESEQKDELDKLTKELNENKGELQEFKKIENTLKTKMEDAKKDKEKNQNWVQEYSEKHEGLTLNEIEADDDEEEGGTKEQQHQPDGEEPPAVKEDPDAPAASHPKKNNVDEKGFVVYDAHSLGKINSDKELRADVAFLEEKVKNAKPDLDVLNEWKEREAEFMRRADDLAKTTADRDAKKDEYESLRSQRLKEFMTGFSAISLKLKEMYQMITLGGNAELELVDSLDPFSEGIIFSVMPPKKSWKNISNLSGGEKTLSSLALVFALHVFKPTPLYFMDEIDAALDFRNVSIVANYIKDRTKNAQFIIISLRNDMFELSHRLIGIYKTANATHSIAIDNKALQGPEHANTSTSAA